MEFAYLNTEFIFSTIYNFLLNGDLLTVPRQLIVFWDGFKIVSTIISLLLLTGIVYSYIRLTQIRNAEREEIERKTGGTASQEETETRRDERWDRVLQQVNSENPNDWRQAIIDADIILDDIVTRAGYPGETLGERMRGIEKSDFRTIDEAWEAHKVRNRIAHDGAEFQLTKREALRVIDLYRQVFEEFYYL